MNMMTKTLFAALAAFSLTSVAFANETLSANQETCAMEAESIAFENDAERQDFLAQCVEELSSQANAEEAVPEEPVANDTPVESENI